MTPVKQFADLTALKRDAGGFCQSDGEHSRAAAATSEARVTLKNPGTTLAFFVRLQVVGSDGEEALPVSWDDNYVTLLPGETRTITARYRARDLKGTPRVIVSGWNVARVVVR